MKAINRALFLLLASVALCQATIARVQSKAANTAGTNATTLALTFDATPTAGNIVVIVAQNAGSNLPMWMAAQNGIAWLDNEQIIGNGSSAIFVGRISSTIASATVTITMSTAQPIAAVGVEYSGTAIRVDKTVYANGNSTSAASGATETTVNANELWVGLVGVRGTNANTISSPTNSFSIVAQTNTTNGTSNADRTVGFLERIVTSTGTANAGGTVTSNLWTAQAMTFEETPTTTAGSTSIPSIGR